MSLENHPLANANSWLFVPASRPERIAKALASGADAVIVDLEDAVAPADKDAARAALLQAIDSLTEQQRARLLVRINAPGTEWFDADVHALHTLCSQGCAGVVLPKAEEAAAMALLANAVGSKGVVVPIIESVWGLHSIDAIAQAPKVLRLAFGHLDFQVDAGMACAADETELVPVRLAVVLASRRARLAAAIDGVTVNTQDGSVVRADAERSVRGGFGGKLCIHPMQVAEVNAAYTPSEAQLQAAQQVLAAADAAQGGVCVVNGRMVDAPVIALARKTVLRHQQASRRGETL
ncbi:HpcH/HpaI aldolase/citrate lyase family protein [Comamonas sp. J-3]|uniref:HpcH/HpaI aldolase/citrate lyase family protein n=1 Tax=Comamonas trifloxystrobinivorans TaxID=3350256 RepID=UPI00372B3A5A